MKKILIVTLALALVLALAACGSADNKNSNASGESVSGASNVSGISNDYYIDLTDLGMKLTIYLRIREDGSFRFSNTTAFETIKSEGKIEKTGSEYLMVYSAVNGEEKSISEGLTSKFIVTDDGSLDFTVSDRIYYGSASATSTSENDPNAKLIARIIPADFEAPSLDSQFTEGVYTAQKDEDWRTVFYSASFYPDDTYLIFAFDGNGGFFSETGRYGVSTSQLALTPQGGNRVSCDILSGTELSLSILDLEGFSGDRTAMTFTLYEGSSDVIATLSGVTSDGAEANLKIFSDGTFETTANGFIERGLAAINSAAGTFKTYPDHPNTGDRGLSQVSNVPSGSFETDAEGKIALRDFRIRTSESLSREKCTFTEN